MTGRHFAATLDSLRYFFRSQLTLAFPSHIDQSETPNRNVSRSKGTRRRSDRCQKIAKKLKGKLKASRSDPRLQRSASTVPRSIDEKWPRAFACSPRAGARCWFGLRRGKKKRGGNFSLGVSSQPAPADVEPHNTPRRCARVHRVTGFFAEASNERTNARYPSAHGSAGRRRGPGARANPIAAVGGTPPRLRRR